jgi:hypothetical protein
LLWVNLAALLCTYSSLWVSADECGSQTVDAYSSVGLAIVVYAAALTGLVQSEVSPDETHCPVSLGDCVVNVLGPL